MRFYARPCCNHRQLGINLNRIGSSVMMHNIGDMRIKYKDGSDAFTEDQLVSKTDPFKQFANWFDQVKRAPEILEPNAMCLATCDKFGQPSARYVLLKGYGKDIDGFTFFTNYNSKKGEDLRINPKAALNFYWDKLNRQIRIEGTVSKLEEEANKEYFKKRPMESQIGAVVSNQSKIIVSREALVEKAKALADSCNGAVEKPEFWGGYLLRPHLFEFWQGQSDRLHDRICYKRSTHGDSWEIFRLSP